MAGFGSSAEARYAAVIGDVVMSRRAADRGALQRRLVEAIDSSSRRLRAALVGPVALFKGDEVQALIGRPESVVDLVVELSEAIFPERFSFGLGFGSLSTEVDEDVARTDGPCFHRARAALEGAKGEAWLVARGFGAAEDSVLTALFALMNAIRGRWTEKQLSYARSARRVSQKSVAAEFGVSPSTVSESLSSSSFADVRQGEDAAKRLLLRFGSRPESNPDSSQ